MLRVKLGERERERESKRERERESTRKKYLKKIYVVKLFRAPNAHTVKVLENV